MKYLAVGTPSRRAFPYGHWRACSSGLHRKAGLLLSLTYEQPQREIWLKLAVDVGARRSSSAAARKRALGEDAAVYLSGDAPRAAQG